MSNAFTNYEGSVSHLIHQREAAFAGLRMLVPLALLTLWPARLQRAPLPGLRVVLRVNEQTDVVAHASERML